MHFYLINQWKIYNGCGEVSKMIITFLIYTEIQWALRCEWLYYVSAVWNNSSVGQIQSVFKMWAKSILFYSGLSFCLPITFPFSCLPYLYVSVSA